MTGIAASQHARQPKHRLPRPTFSPHTLLPAAILILLALPSQALVIAPGGESLAKAPAVEKAVDADGFSFNQALPTRAVERPTTVPMAAEQWLFIKGIAPDRLVAPARVESAPPALAAAVSVAEPSTGVLLVLGLLGLIWIRHRI